MHGKKSEEANLEKRKRSFYYIGIVIALACTLIAFEWASNSTPIELVQPISEDAGVTVIKLSYDNVPDKPSPISSLDNAIPSKVDTSGLNNNVFFGNSQDLMANQISYPEGEFVDPYEAIKHINPFPGKTTKSIFDIDERPHLESCLNGQDYNPLIFDCTVSEVFKMIEKNLKVPECVKHSSGKMQVVLAMIAMDETGKLDKIIVLNADDVCEECVTEATRVLQYLPKMNPGIYAGKPIPVAFTVPIKFQFIEQ
jgi:hypothetical protein